ncbi:MAG: FAD-dependent oxidoreductase [Oscillospiraceae bacterium]
MSSVWQKDCEIQKFDSLNGDIKTDVLIIGGGMAGILCAYLLKQSGVNYCLVEANEICSGITKNTTAKITAQHGLIYDKLINELSFEDAKKYLTINLLSLKRYKALCKEIDCDFEEKDSFVYSLDDKEKIEKEVRALISLGIKAEFKSDVPLPFKISGAALFPNQAEFNPLKFVREISKDLNIYENTFVKELKGNIAITEKGNITAKDIIVTTHFPFINKHGSYFLKMYQHRSYAIALENAPSVNGMYVDEKQKGMSFRNYENLLIIGGGDHRTGKKGGNFDELRDFAKKNYPDATEKYCWATQDCMTLDGIPYIGNYSKSTKHLYVATGFNKWGMTSSMVSAMILCDMILERKNVFSDIFSPSRSILKPQLLANGFEAAISLLTPSTKRCPHLGCTLKWNKAEHSWDCPCHGSRFTENGKLIDNPATGDLKNM